MTQTTLLKLARLAKTNDAAFDEFHATVTPHLRTRALRIVRDHHAATEIADDVMLDWRLKWDPARCRDDAALMAWLFKTNTRRIIDYQRRGRRPMLPLEQEVPAVAGPSTLEAMIAEEDQPQLARALRGARLVIARRIRHVLRELRHRQRKKQAIRAPALLWLGRVDWWEQQLRTRPEIFLESPAAMKGTDVAARLQISAATVSRLQQRITAEAHDALRQYLQHRR